MVWLGGLIALELDVIDYIFFALAIALKPCFQKIADPTDTAPTAAVALTINDIAAVFLPAGLAYLWLISPSAVVTLAACMALTSLNLSLLIPRHPMPGHETIFHAPVRSLIYSRYISGAGRLSPYIAVMPLEQEPDMFSLLRKKTEMPTAETALPGRAAPIPTAPAHFIFHRPLTADIPEGMQVAMFGMGCFWGVERKFWKLDGIHLTMVGYAGGFTPNATYDEVCTGRTGHNEVVRVVYDPKVTSYEALLKEVWEGHDPTQGMRQGNDAGTQYRSGIYTFGPAQQAAAEASRAMFGPRLLTAGYGPITTEIIPAPDFYFAEDYHQQYLAKNPAGYCGIGGTGVTCPIGVPV